MQTLFIIAFLVLSLSICFVCYLQWTISELACYTYSLVAVPLYDTLGTEAIEYIIDRGTWANAKLICKVITPVNQTFSLVCVCVYIYTYIYIYDQLVSVSLSQPPSPR